MNQPDDPKLIDTYPTPSFLNIFVYFSRHFFCGLSNFVHCISGLFGFVDGRLGLLCTTRHNRSHRSGESGEIVNRRNNDYCYYKIQNQLCDAFFVLHFLIPPYGTRKSPFCIFRLKFTFAKMKHKKKNIACQLNKNSKMVSDWELR